MRICEPDADTSCENAGFQDDSGSVGPSGGRGFTAGSGSSTSCAADGSTDCSSAASGADTIAAAV